MFALVNVTNAISPRLSATGGCVRGDHIHLRVDGNLIDLRDRRQLLAQYVAAAVGASEQHLFSADQREQRCGQVFRTERRRHHIAVTCKRRSASPCAPMAAN